MTDRQAHLLRIMADPTSHVDLILRTDRAAIQAAIDLIEDLQARVERLDWENNMLKSGLITDDMPPARKDRA